MIPTEPAKEPIFNIHASVVAVLAVLVFVQVGRSFLSPDDDLWLVIAGAFIPARYGPIASELPGGTTGDVHLAVNSHVPARRLGASRIEFRLAARLRRCNSGAHRHAPFPRVFYPLRGSAARWVLSLRSQPRAADDRRVRRHLGPHGRHVEVSLSCHGFRRLSPFA